MQVIPTIYFPGLCAEAISFYRDVLGAEVLSQLTAGGAQPAYLPPGSPGKILRATLRIGDSTVYLSEGHHESEPVFQGISMVLYVDHEDEVRRLLPALSAGGSIRVPLRATAWAEHYANVVDRFGMFWSIEAGRRGHAE